jgi:hypothetical protein
MPSVAFVINGTLAKSSGHFLSLCRTTAVDAGWAPEFIVTEKADAVT